MRVKNQKVVARYIALCYNTFDKINPVAIILFLQPSVLSHLIRY